MLCYFIMRNEAVQPQNAPFAHFMTKRKEYAMTMYDNLPRDPVMLLSFINTQLRDNYGSFDELAAAYQADGAVIAETLRAIDYEYDASVNQFV